MSTIFQPPSQPCDAGVDVLITGAGLAGVALALQLHRAGLRVCLLGVPRRFDALEGMAERARRALQVLGCERALQALGPKVLRRAHWSGESFDGNHEYLVERAPFDRALWRDAAAAGVAVCESRVLRVERDGEHWRCAHEGGELRAPFWVEARGRAAPRSAQQQRAPSTVAVAAWWRSQPERPTAGVHALANGWLWYARLPDGRLSAQVFVDAADVPPRSQLLDFYTQQLAQESSLTPLLAGAERLGEPHARGAGLTLSEPLIERRCARVGDAALALDPLAGHGQFEALGSALALAPCVRTLLQFPEREALAMRFYRDRMRGDFLAMARNGRDFYALEQGHAERRFWAARQRWPDAEPSHPPMQRGVGRVEARPVSVDGFVEERQVVVCPDQPRGVWQIDGVPLLALLRALRGFGVPSRERLPEFARELSCPEPAVGRALAWLGARGLLALQLPPD